MLDSIAHMDGRILMGALIGLLLASGLLYLFLNRVGAQPLKARALLTGNEQEFYQRLRRALPALNVLPQVGMSALVDVALSPLHPKFWEVRRVFAMKTIDYVVCRPKDMSVVAVVELDDRSHDEKKSKDRMRDAMLSSVGIVTIRWDSRAKPSVDQIASRFAKLTPAK